MTTTNASPRLSPRAAGIAASVLALADGARCVPENDNAGDAWRAADERPYIDDYRVSVEVRDRGARDLATAIEAALCPTFWRAWFRSSDRASVHLYPTQPACRAVSRRTRALREMLRGVRLDVL
jgi:hypothetical protein